jgi:hypothetical protein
MRNVIFKIFLLSLLAFGCGGDATSDKKTRIMALKEKGLYGFINEQGEKIVPPKYVYAYDFSEGLAAINIAGSTIGKDVPRNGKWGFIDMNQKIVINPKYYSPAVYAPLYNPELLSFVLHEAYVFSDSLAAVRTADEWVYINKKDSVVISGLGMQAARKFKEGLAAVMMNGRWGYINKKGEIVIPARFLFPANFTDGHAFVMDDQLNAYVIDKTGKRMYSQYRITSNFHEGYAPLKGGYRGDKFNLKENLLMGLIDSTGYVIIEPQFESIGEYGSGLVPVLVGSEKQEGMYLKDDFKTLKYNGGKWGFINLKNEFIIHPVYDEARGFHEGLAPVRVGDKWGYIEPSGKWAFEPQFKSAGFFEGGLAKVIMDDPHKRPYIGTRAIINKDGVIWVDP